MANITELLHIVDLAHKVRFTSLAAGTMMVLDHLITLDQEVELIWRSSNGSGKWLFIVNRYYGLGTALFNNYAVFTPYLTDSASGRWFQWQGSSGIILCFIAELILQLRLFALYHLNRKILAFMVTAFAVTALASGTLVIVALGKVGGRVVVADIPICVPTNVPPYLYLLWIPTLAFEILLCGLAVFRGFRNLRLKSSLYYSGKELLDVLLRDSVMYFLILSVAYGMNMIIFIVKPGALIELSTVFSAATSCIMSNRLLLNIRQTVHDRDEVVLPQSQGGVPYRVPRREFVEMEELGSRASL